MFIRNQKHSLRAINLKPLQVKQVWHRWMSSHKHYYRISCPRENYHNSMGTPRNTKPSSRTSEPTLLQSSMTIQPSWRTSFNTAPVKLAIWSMIALWCRLTLDSRWRWQDSRSDLEHLTSLRILTSSLYWTGRSFAKTTLKGSSVSLMN